MKKTVLLSLLTFCVSLLHAQLKLDSLVTVNDNKIVFTYNEEGKVAESIEYQLDVVSNQWVLHYHNTWTYALEEVTQTTYEWNIALQQWVPKSLTRLNDGAAFLYEMYEWDSSLGAWKGISREYNLLTSIGFDYHNDVWDSATHAWKNWLKTTYQTNQWGSTTESISYKWINNAWVLTLSSRRYQHSYDAEGRVLEETFAQWEPGTLTWANLDKRTWEYNALGQETDYASYYWSVETNEWIGQSRRSPTYENSHIVSEIQYHWNENSSFWEPRWQYVYAYNPDSTLATVDLFGLDDELENWTFVRPYRGYLYTYTPEGKLSEQITSQWHPSLEIMTYSNKTNYTYDEAGNLIDYATYNWNAFFENWYNVYREKKEYDLTTKTTELVYPSSYSYLFELGKLTSYELYSLDVIFNDWHLDSKTLYYFSEFLTATNETHTSESLKLFPNPAGDLLTPGANAPRASSYQIIDLNGRMLQQEKAWNGEGIDVSQLIPGSYVIRLIEGNRVITGKFIKS